MHTISQWFTDSLVNGYCDAVSVVVVVVDILTNIFDAEYLSFMMCSLCQETVTLI